MLESNTEMNFKEVCEGLHLLARPALATVVTIVMGWVVIEAPFISIDRLALIPAAAVAYIGVKWTGNRITK